MRVQIQEPTPYRATNCPIHASNYLAMNNDDDDE